MPGACLKLTTSVCRQTSVGHIRPVATRVHNVEEEINLKRFAAVVEGVFFVALFFSTVSAHAITAGI